MAKKTFRDNPALQFISSAEVALSAETAQPLESASLAAPRRAAETRSKRLNLLMQPGLHGRLCALAERDGVSLNELIHRVLADFAEKELSHK